MKKIKKVNESQFWQIVGLLSLAEKNRKQIEYIQEAIGDTLGIDDTSGHIGDMVWGASEGDANKLLEREGIELP